MDVYLDYFGLNSLRIYSSVIFERHISKTTGLTKMLGLYLLGQNCLHLTFEQYLSSETYSRKYEKLPNIVILACKNITEKMHLLKISGPQIWLCLFTF